VILIVFYAWFRGFDIGKLARHVTLRRSFEWLRSAEGKYMFQMLDCPCKAEVFSSSSTNYLFLEKGVLSQFGSSYFPGSSIADPLDYPSLVMNQPNPASIDKYQAELISVNSANLHADTPWL
jgi:hypothetical protein